MIDKHTYTLSGIKYPVLLMVLLQFTLTLPGQVLPGSGIFTVDRILPATPVKDQNRTNTCWAFSGISLLESELLRLGKGNYDLSEMFIVRHVYQEKAVRYVRMHGATGFAGGGAFNDVTEAILEYGIVPDSLYTGLKPGESSYDHSGMDSLLRAYVDRVIQNESGVLLPEDWYQGYCSLLDSCLGNVPGSFPVNGKTCTPESYARGLELDLNNYVLLSSFTHHPLYEKFIIEIPDNWSWGEVYNVSISELTDIIDHAIAAGYTVAWAADVSEKDFSRSTGVAVVTVDNKTDPPVVLNENQTLSQVAPLAEKEITPEIRQEAFDNYATTDDHGMHIIGIATDMYGQELYVVKNSWGTDSGPHQGYYFVSKAYVRYKTTTLMLNKNALPDDITKKLFR